MNKNMYSMVEVQSIVVSYYSTECRERDGQARYYLPELWMVWFGGFMVFYATLTIFQLCRGGQFYW